MQLQVGQKIGKLKLISLRIAKGRARGLFECECGNLKDIRLSHVLSGDIVSCGCYRSERLTREIQPTLMDEEEWKRIQGLDCEWIEFDSYYRDVGVRQSRKAHLVKLDSSKSYGPKNFRWTYNNRDREVKYEKELTYAGKTLTLREWAPIVKKPLDVLHHRYDLGWTTEDILLKPVRKKRR